VVIIKHTRNVFCKWFYKFFGNRVHFVERFAHAVIFTLITDVRLV